MFLFSASFSYLFSLDLTSSAVDFLINILPLNLDSNEKSLSGLIHLCLAALIEELVSPAPSLFVIDCSLLFRC